MTAAELLARLPHDGHTVTVDDLEDMLTESADAGIVEHVDGHWRLTAWAEARYGRALRELSPVVEAVAA